MHYDLIIKNGTIVTPAESFRADIAVNGGLIANIGKLDVSDTADTVYDAAALHILPGIIDAHVHFRDPGLTDKEDFQTGSMAAAFGGITCAAEMPNTVPVTATVERFNEKVSIARSKSYIDFAFFALLNNDNTSEIERLRRAGALGFKIFLGSSTGDIAAPSPAVLYDQMESCAKAGIRIGFHAETSELNARFTAINKTKREKSIKKFLQDLFIRDDGSALSKSRPVISEAFAIQTAICFAKYTEAKIHIHHVTSADGCELIAEAKQKGLDVTAETCPHYLLFNAEKSAHKVYPPIRGEEHRKALWEAVKNGTIDMFATDHAPHTAAEKAKPLQDAPAGLCGVETFVPLMLNEVNRGTLSLNDFVRLASEAPAKIWGMYPKKGALLCGTDADFTVVDMGKKSKINVKALHSKSKTSPYNGMKVQGSVAATIVRGKFIMRDGKLISAQGYGEFVTSH